MNFEDIFKKCEFLYVSDLKRAKIWKYFEKVWVPVHYCSYIYQQGTYKISHQVIFDKFWLLLWKGASSCMFLALLLLTWNIQEHTLFGEKVWVLVCSCQTHIDCRNIQELTPFHKKFSEKVWVPVHSWPIPHPTSPNNHLCCLHVMDIIYLKVAFYRAIFLGFIFGDFLRCTLHCVLSHFLVEKRQMSCHQIGFSSSFIKMGMLLLPMCP